MPVKVVNYVYGFDLELDDGTGDTMALDSGAGCSVWPKGRHSGSSMTSPGEDCNMVAANSPPIKHYGRRKAIFKGMKVDEVDFVHRVDVSRGSFTSSLVRPKDERKRNEEKREDGR